MLCYCNIPKINKFGHLSKGDSGLIITKLLGGLGNQMFQYAAGLALARSNRLPLCIDVSALRAYKFHQGYQFETIFSGTFNQASRWELFRMLGLGKSKVTHGSISVYPEWQPNDHTRWIRQSTHNFWPGFRDLDRACYLAGYWQSPKYFADVESELRAAFSFREPLAGPNLEVAARIAEGNSVSLHIRRGDYISNLSSNRFHGICDWDYYERSIELIQRRLPDAHFFAFSDEPEAVKSYFSKDERIEVIDINSGITSYRDMQLMTACRHHVIANSTFSWWAAWLAGYPEKIVIAPSNWFAGSKETVVDIYEPSWIRI